MRLKKLSSMLLCAALILLGSGGLVSYNTKKFYATAKPVSGKVVEIQENMTNGVLLYKPVIVFLAENGSQYKIVPGRGSNPAHHKVGQIVSLLYDPSNPQVAKLDKETTAGFFSAFLFVFGAVVLILGVALFIYSRGYGKRKK